MQNVQKEELLKFNKPLQIITFMLCMKEKRIETGIRIPKFVLIEIFKEVNYLFEDSSILIDKKHKEMLVNWILEANDIPKQESKMIYKASKDGFAASKFHKHCDYKTNTISIIKANNFIFGGFTSISWHSDEISFGFKIDPKAFIFSISNPSNQPIKFKIRDEDHVYAISCSETLGPIFGLGPDIQISNNSNQNSRSVSNLGASFEGCPFENGTEGAVEFLCGFYDFKVQEIEVFQLF